MKRRYKQVETIDITAHPFGWQWNSYSLLGEYKLVPHLENTLAVPVTISGSSFISSLRCLVSQGDKHGKILFSLTNAPLYQAESPCQLRNRLP